VKRSPENNIIHATLEECGAEGYRQVNTKQELVQKGDLLVLTTDAKNIWAELDEASAKEFRKMQSSKPPTIKDYQIILRNDNSRRLK
jgi:hypothetical protein